MKPVKTYQERPTPKDLEDVSDVKEIFDMRSQMHVVVDAQVL